MSAPARPRITLIVARAANGVIGRDNAMPWHLPEDLRHFKATTLGHPLVMGRRTFESIGRPLPGRRTIVLTRDPLWAHPGCERASSIEDAVTLAEGAPELFIAGGGQVYRDALGRELADRVIVTEVALEPAGDAVFPPLDPRQWQLEDRREHRSAGGIGYAIATYRRRSPENDSATIPGTPP